MTARRAKRGGEEEEKHFFLLFHCTETKIKIKIKIKINKIKKQIKSSDNFFHPLPLLFSITALALALTAARAALTGVKWRSFSQSVSQCSSVQFIMIHCQLAKMMMLMLMMLAKSKSAKRPVNSIDSAHSWQYCRHSLHSNLQPQWWWQGNWRH